MTSQIKLAATEISKSRLTSMWPLMHNAVNARKTKACSFLKLFTASLLHHVPRLHILPWSRFSLLKPELETTDQGPLRSDQTEIFRSLYAIRPNGIRLDITPTLGFFSAFIIASGTTVGTGNAHALRVTEFPKNAHRSTKKKGRLP